LSRGDPIEKLAGVLTGARKVAVLSGAGLSAESGVPTFRGKEGLWKQRNPVELATPEAFRADPELVWEFYNWRRQKILGVEPNPAHVALADLERRVPAFVHVTQNIDGLARRAGGENIIELHGNLFSTRCFECGREQPDLSGPVPFPTSCERCGGLVRPGVVWFGEPVPLLEDAIESLRDADLLFVVGTSAVVQPAASLAMVCKSAGAFVAEFNIEATPLSGRLDLQIVGPVGTTLPRVVARAFAGG